MIRKAPAHPSKDYEGIGAKLNAFVMHSIEIINTKAFYILTVGVGILLGLLWLLGVSV